jgi:hypothetical protein
MQNAVVLQMLSARGVSVINRFEDNNGNGYLMIDKGKHCLLYWYFPDEEALFQNAVSYESSATSSARSSAAPRSSFDEKMKAKLLMEKKRIQVINRANELAK